MGKRNSKHATPPDVAVDRRTQEAPPRFSQPPGSPVGVVRPPKPAPSRICGWPGCERYSGIRWTIDYIGPKGAIKAGSWRHLAWCQMHDGRRRRGQDMDAPFGKIQQARWDHMQRLQDEYRDATECTEEELQEKRAILETAIIGWARVAVSGGGVKWDRRASQPVSPSERIALPGGPATPTREVASAAARKGRETVKRLYGRNYFVGLGSKASATRRIRNERFGKGKTK